MRHNNVLTIFPTPLLLSWPLDNGLVARKTVCPLSAGVTTIFSVIFSQSPCGLYSMVEYLSSQIQAQRMTIILLRNFLNKDKRVDHLTRTLSR